VPAGTIKVFGASGLASDFIFDIAAPELALLPEPELGVPPFGVDEAVLSLEFEAVESAGLLLQPSATKQR